MRIYTYARRQAKSSQKSSSNSRRAQPVRAALPAFEEELLELGWIAQGSVLPQPPRAWRLTRKVKAKTVSIALSEQQVPLYKAAIADHRKLEAILHQMREMSDRVLQQSVPGVRKRPQENIPKPPSVAPFRSATNRVLLEVRKAHVDDLRDAAARSLRAYALQAPTQPLSGWRAGANAARLAGRQRIFGLPSAVPNRQSLEQAPFYPSRPSRRFPTLRRGVGQNSRP